MASGTISVNESPPLVFCAKYNKAAICSVLCTNVCPRVSKPVTWACLSMPLGLAMKHLSRLLTPRKLLRSLYILALPFCLHISWPGHYHSSSWISCLSNLAAVILFSQTRFFKKVGEEKQTVVCSYVLFATVIRNGSRKPNSTLNINQSKRKKKKKNVRQKEKKTYTKTSMVCHHHIKVLLINKTTGRPQYGWEFIL